jgi:Tol biopolymer transport system component
MFSPIARHQPFRPFRSLLPPLLVVAAALMFEACDGTESPLAPAEDLPAPASESAAPDLAVAALLSPRIAFTSYRNGNQDIYLMNAQGYQVVRLTTASTYEVEPAWSYDNKRIALVRPRLDASKVTHYDIYIIDADGTHGHWARPTPYLYNLGSPSWAPDGSHLLATVSANGTTYPAWLHLSSGTIGFFPDAGGILQGQQPSYDPTGQRIVFIGSNSKSLDVMNANASGHVKLLSAPGSTIEGPVFSPDGKRIAFSNAASNGDQEIFVRNADGSVKRLTYTAGTDLWPSWSPDGSRIVFGSTRNGKLQIWTMSATGGSATRISRNSYTERTPAFSH